MFIMEIMLFTWFLMGLGRFGITFGTPKDLQRGPQRDPEGTPMRLHGASRMSEMKKDVKKSIKKISGRSVTSTFSILSDIHSITNSKKCKKRSLGDVTFSNQVSKFRQTTET